MPNKHGRSNEQDISMAVLRYLANTQHGEATIADIKKNIPKFINLTPDDQVQSETRPNEQLWEQLVRNIVSHRTSADSFIADGLMTHSPRRLTITDAGRAYVKKKG